MGNYTDKANSVRVDFFRASGKWYVTDAVEWLTYEGSPAKGGKLIHDAFAEALVTHLRGEPNVGRTRLEDMTAVCLDPYHEHAHPLMMTVKDAIAIVDGTRPKYTPLS